MNWLFTDFGPNFGDNFRGFTFIKALKTAHPEAWLTCWLTPELNLGLGGLMPHLGFVDEFLVAPRPPKQSYQIIFDLLKRVLAAERPFTLPNLPQGEGPDGKTYDRVIPTCEPWFLAKLLAGHQLNAPDVENQGITLCRLLLLGEEQVADSLPLFGRRQGAEGPVCLGLSRPGRNDKKQLAPGRVEQVWQRVLASGRQVVALDYQDWNPPPASPKVRDQRRLPWRQKVETLNRASCFIGVDGGLTHFAAACGCPTVAFYGTDPSNSFGRLVGPHPRETPFGGHVYCHDFAEYLTAVERALA